MRTLPVAVITPVLLSARCKSDSMVTWPAVVLGPSGAGVVTWAWTAVTSPTSKPRPLRAILVAARGEFRRQPKRPH